MLDVIASIVLTALAFSVTGVLLLPSPAPAADRRRLAGWIAGWFAAVTTLGALGLFSAGRLGTPAVGAAVLSALAVALVAAVRSPALRAVIDGIPLPSLIVVHAGRLLGILFIVLYAADRLPPTFALTAGLGDIAVALAALPVAWMAHRRAAGWRPLALTWNAIGAADLVTAVTLGVGSAPGSPLRFLHESPGNEAMGTLPWLLVPTLLVPLYLLSHLAIFARLARRAHGREAAQPVGAT